MGGSMTPELLDADIKRVANERRQRNEAAARKEVLIAQCRHALTGTTGRAVVLAREDVESILEFLNPR